MSTAAAGLHTHPLAETAPQEGKGAVGQRHIFATLLVAAALFFGPRLARAGDGVRAVSEEQAREIQLLLRVHTILAEMQEQVGYDEAVGRLDDLRLQQTLRTYASRLIDAYQPVAYVPVLKKLKPTILAKVAWDKLADHVREAAHSMKHAARTKGVAVAAGVGLGVALDPLMCALLPAVGAPLWMVGVSLATPYPLILPGLIGMAQDKVAERKLRALYDSPERYHRLRQSAAMARQALRLRGATDVLVPLFADEGFRRTLAVTNKGRVGRFLEWLGWQPKTATYERLTGLLKELRPEDRFLSMLERDHATPKLVKAAMLATYLDSDSDPNLRAALQTRFADNVRTRPVVPGFAALETWALSTVGSRSFPELGARVREVPPGAPVRLVARIWKEAILPDLAHGPLAKMSPRRLAELRRQATRLMVDADHAEQPNWDESWSERLANAVTTELSSGQCLRRFAQLGALARRAFGGGKTSAVR